MERWQTDIVDWTKLTEQSAQFYIHLAESRLKSTEDTANIITASNDRLLGIITMLISASFGYLFTGDQTYLQCVSLFILLSCSVAAVFLLRNMGKYELFTIGEEPRQIFTSAFVENNIYSESQQYLNIVFQMMEIMQLKIDKNRQINLIRQSRLEKAKRILVAIPLSFLLAGLYLYFLNYQ